MNRITISMMSLVCIVFWQLSLFGAKVELPKGEEAIVNGCFNAPGDSRLLGWRLRSGGLGTFELTEPQDGSPEAVLTITAKATDPKPWMMELHQSVVKKVEKGSTMYVTFEYKMTKEYSFQFYWQVEKAPWPKLLSMRLTTPENTWRRIRVAAPVHETYLPEQTAFSFHLAEAKGILQLREMYAVIVPNDYNPEELETNETAVLGGDFYDRVWRAKVTEDMKNTRCVPMKIHAFKLRPNAPNSKNHPPAAEAVVILKQTSSPFVIGTGANLPILYPELLKRPEFEKLSKRIGGFSDMLVSYRRHLLGNPMFTRLTVTDAMVWKNYLTWGREISEKLIADCQENGMSLCLGSLYIPTFSAMPPGLKGQPHATVNEKLMQYIEEMARRHAGKVSDWIVIHNVISDSEVYDYIGVDSLPQAFKVARQGDDKALLNLSDGNALSAISEVPLQDLVEFAVWLRDSAGVKIDGLVLDSCMKRLDVGPQTLEKRLKIIHDSLPEVPIHIVNLAINMPKEEFQADMLRDYMLLFYAQDYIKSVSLGELWSPVTDIPAMGYLKEDFTPKRNYLMIQKLLSEEWLSNEELKTNAAGDAECTLFGGKYDAVVACGNLKKSFNLTIPEGLMKNSDSQWSVTEEGVEAFFDKKEKTAVLNIYLK